MDQTTFDHLTRTLVDGTDRRQALRLLAGGILGVLAGPLAVDGPDAADARTRRCGAGKKRCGNRCIPRDKCCPGRTRSCYSGPAGTAGVGICAAGTQTCQSDGTWGACEGQVTPRAETCNGQDDDCNGQVDNGNLCSAGEVCENGRCCRLDGQSCTAASADRCCSGQCFNFRCGVPEEV